MSVKSFYSWVGILFLDNICLTFCDSVLLNALSKPTEPQEMCIRDRSVSCVQLSFHVIILPRDMYEASNYWAHVRVKGVVENLNLLQVVNDAYYYVNSYLYCSVND